MSDDQPDSNKIDDVTAVYHAMWEAMKPEGEKISAKADARAAVITSALQNFWANHRGLQVLLSVFDWRYLTLPIALNLSQTVWHWQGHRPLLVSAMQLHIFGLRIARWIVKLEDFQTAQPEAAAEWSATLTHDGHAWVIAGEKDAAGTQEDSTRTTNNAAGVPDSESTSGEGTGGL